MNRVIRGFLIFLIMELAIVSTGHPETIPKPAPAIIKIAASFSSGNWKKDWDDILTQAKKEGSVVLYTGWGPKTRTMLSQAFKSKFGISLEFAAFSRGSEMVAKVTTEYSAGLHLPDFLGDGSGTLLSFKRAGLLGPSIEPLLILPEVKNPNAWRGGKLPFMDNEKRNFGMLAVANRRILYNTNLVKDNEITGYMDLLKPLYKGKILLNDPSTSGAGIGLFTDLAHSLWDVERASEYLRQLLKNDTKIVRDTRLHVEEVARGKFAVALAPTSDVSREFIDLGAPLKFVIIKDGVLIGPGKGCIGLAPDSPHPYAAIVFINWLLSKEGQTLFSKSANSPSFRQDVPSEGVSSALLPVPGEKIIIDTEEINIARSKMMKVAKQVMEEARKSK